MSGQKDQNQSWWNCKYAVGVRGENGTPSCGLDKNKLYDVYGCENKEILKLDGSTPIFVWFQYRSDRYYSVRIAALSPTVICEECKHYKPKENNPRIR